jgi:type II secretory pathway pseudopilin PulG
VHHKTLLILLISAVLFDFTGCVSMSAQARRERAYRHYVQKQIKQRQRATARAQKAANRQLKAKMKTVQPSEPQVTSSVQNFAESWSEPVAAPVTVSASDSIAPQNPDQPSPP